jgi:hypothetical protein
MQFNTFIYNIIEAYDSIHRNKVLRTVSEFNL